MLLELTDISRLISLAAFLLGGILRLGMFGKRKNSGIENIDVALIKSHSYLDNGDCFLSIGKVYIFEMLFDNKNPSEKPISLSKFIHFSQMGAYEGLPNVTANKWNNSNSRQGKPHSIYNKNYKAVLLPSGKAIIVFKMTVAKASTLTHFRLNKSFIPIPNNPVLPPQE